MSAHQASQSAARKLAQIVGILVMSIIALTLFYFHQARQGIDVIEREKLGLRLADITVPVLLDPSVSPTADIKAVIADLEDELGLPADKRFASLFSDPSRSQASNSQRMYFDYLEDIGLVSGLVLDSDAQSSFLATTEFINLPAVVSGFIDVLDGLQETAVSGAEKNRDMSQVLIDVGGIQEANHRLVKSFRSASAVSSEMTAYAALEKMVGRFGAEARALEDMSNDAGRQALQEQMQSFSKNAAKRRELLSDARNISDGVRSILRRHLEKRSTALWQRLLAMTIGGLMSALCGVALAVVLFRSTLVRLDEVETARVEADAARKEAETMASQLTVINGDISRLNQELASNVQKLKAAQDGLIKKGRMEQIGQLTATIAHEIRNPLGAVRTSAFLLERKIAGKGLNVEGQLQRINNGVTRCDDIINQLLDFSRTKQIAATLGNLDEWLAKTVREEAARLPEMVFIECALGLENKDVPFDASRLERAIVNLLKNACEAMVGSGDEPSKFTTTHPRIWVKTRFEGAYATVRVVDNGPGISAENLARIREPLFTTKSFGTGLGIPAIEQIAVQHGGRLDIESTPGNGAAFTIYLPRKVLGEQAA